MVKVRLVENRANNRVGSVIVVNEIVHTKIPGTALRAASSPWPSITCHETVSAVPSGVVAVTSAEACAKSDEVAVLASEEVRLERLNEFEREGLVNDGGGGGATGGGGGASMARG